MSTPQSDAASGTGAVRNQIPVRPALISPCGIATMARLYRAGAADWIMDERPTTTDLIARALRLTYRYLGGGPVSDLELATLHVFEATAAESPGWDDPRLPTTSYPTSVGYELIPIPVWRGLAATYKEGADKRGDFNWEFGMTVLDCLDHGIAHLIDRLDDDDSEPHMAHACWNYLGAIHSHKMWPKLNRPHRRRGGLAPGADAGRLTDRRPYPWAPVAPHSGDALARIVAAMAELTPGRWLHLAHLDPSA